jgi:GT2 family glycosyltransferase
MDISVIVVNYNTKQLTSACIESIFQNTQGVDFEVILIDNKSEDGSRELFENDNRITYIWSFENLGFGRANNVGMLLAHGKYIFLLNSDTLVLNNALKSFYDYAENDGALSIYGTWLKNKNGGITHSYGFFFHFRDFLSNVFGYHILRKNGKKEIFSSSVISVDYITGADLFFEKKIVQQYGGFDYRYFMYCEENDWERRMATHSIERKIIGGPCIMHLQGGSQNNTAISIKKRICIFNSMCVYACNFLPYYQYFFYRCMFLFVQGLSIWFKSYTIREKLYYLRYLLIKK